MLKTSQNHRQNQETYLIKFMTVKFFFLSCILLKPYINKEEHFKRRLNILHPYGVQTVNYFNIYIKPSHKKNIKCMENWLKTFK